MPTRIESGATAQAGASGPAVSHTHHFTVDVEEFFQVSAFEGHVRREDWETMPSRVEASTETIVEWMAERGARGTFFVLGWVAERRPALIRRIAAAGHEIASHGQNHERVTTLEAAAFRESVARSKRVLEDLVGAPVLGYRAPSFSIVPGLEWALDILIEEGYRYDSSLYPVRRRGYGYPAGSPDPWWVQRPAGALFEVPPATIGIGRMRLPAGGGGTFRHLPYALVQRAFAEAEGRGASATFYIHPWEIDPDQPRIAVPRLTRVRHYRGLDGTGPRLRQLLSEFRFRPIAETFGEA